MAILQQLKSFIKEANKLADAFSTIGEDDNGYDASGLARDAKEWADDVRSKKVTEADATVWLASAKKSLDEIA